MQTPSFHLPDFKRIGYAGPCAPDLAPRGGYCDEVNGLFSMALTALGIPPTLALTRPLFYPVRQPKTHTVVIAQIDDQPQLCDWGFGSYGLVELLAFDPLETIVEQGFGRYRLVVDPATDERVLQAWMRLGKEQGEWKNPYAVDPHPAERIGCVPAHCLNSAHPDSISVQTLLAIRHNPQGRRILFGQQLTELTANTAAKQTLSLEDIPQTLGRVFGLEPTTQGNPHAIDPRTRRPTPYHLAVCGKRAQPQRSRVGRGGQIPSARRL